MCFPPVSYTHLSQLNFARKSYQKPYVSYVVCLLSICKRTPLLDTEGFNPVSYTHLFYTLRS